MAEEKPTGLYDVISTPSGKFRTWHESRTMECMADGAWRSIPEPAQDEIKRLTVLAANLALEVKAKSK